MLAQSRRCVRRLGGQHLPAPPLKLLVALVGELGVGDGDPAGQAAQGDFALAFVDACESVDQRIDGGVNPADEEAATLATRVGSPPRATSLSSPAM